MKPTLAEPVLIIKLSALGDFIQALGAFRAIRRHHADAHITLLTTRPYSAIASASGYFDEVWIDERAPWWRADKWLPFVRRLRQARFTRIYDLQWSQRTNTYFRLLDRPRSEWVGVAPGCSHYYPGRNKPQHIRARQAEMLAHAGINHVPQPDLSFLTADLTHFNLPDRYALLVPGSSGHRLVKRWPVQRYVEVAKILAERGLISVLICGPEEREEARTIAGACPEVYDIETGVTDIVELARRASVAIGNDTGPLHLIAAAGCPVVALFSRESDPVKLSLPGPTVVVLQRPSLEDLPLGEVLEAVARIERKTP